MIKIMMMMQHNDDDDDDDDDDMDVDADEPLPETVNVECDAMRCEVKEREMMEWAAFSFSSAMQLGVKMQFTGHDCSGENGAQYQQNLGLRMDFV